MGDEPNRDELLDRAAELGIEDAAELEAADLAELVADAEGAEHGAAAGEPPAGTPLTAEELERANAPRDPDAGNPAADSDDASDDEDEPSVDEDPGDGEDAAEPVAEALATIDGAPAHWVSDVEVGRRYVALHVAEGREDDARAMLKADTFHVAGMVLTRTEIAGRAMSKGRMVLTTRESLG